MPNVDGTSPSFLKQIVFSENFQEWALLLSKFTNS
jgi:hypothetical protein